MLSTVLAAALCGGLVPQDAVVAPSSAIVGAELVYEVRAGDSLTLIGARHGADVPVIARANGLSPTARLRPGMRLHIDNRHLVPASFETPIVINVPQRMLFFSEGALPRGYPLALGSPGWRTPLAAFSIVKKEIDPTWDVPASIQAEMRQKRQPVRTKVPPGPANPLGARWIGLSLGSIGVHGTNAPASIYRHATHGCIRMQPDDIVEFFDLVEVGTPGRIVYEPVLVGAVGDRIFVEIHRDVYRLAPDPLVVAKQRLEEACLLELVDWPAVVAAVKERAGIARDVTRLR